MLGIKKDEELNSIFGDADFSECGVQQFVAPELKKGFKNKKKKALDEIEEEEENE